MTAELPVQLGQIVANKYAVDSIIGRGGMGVVLAAHHVELDQKVAIKFLLADVAQHSDAAERFRREARAVAQIHSDHAVRVLDVGTLPDDVPYMVMEYLEGRDLGAKMADGDSFTIEQAAGYMLEAIDAIGQAHRAGIVHRDLKPANLFLAKRPDGSYRIKVLDFGISKSLLDKSYNDLRLTSTTTLIGSPLYMSPEQMQSARDVDARADIWSLGAILFEMLAGRPPYQADTLPQLCKQLLSSDPPPLREFRPEAPAELETVIARCLRRNLDERWPAVSDLAAALAKFAPRHRSVRPPGTTTPLAERAPPNPGRLQQELGLGAQPELPGTPHGWGTTRESRRPRKAALFLVLALLAAGAAAAVLWPSSHPEQLSEAPAAAAPAAEPPAPGQAEQPGALDLETKTEAEDRGTVVLPVAPDPAQVLPDLEGKRVPAKPPPRPALGASPPRPVPPPTPAQSSVAPGEALEAREGLSDFGGRR